jgi:asparagine synthetase B (glutamine-hydrolysing)
VSGFALIFDQKKTLAAQDPVFVSFLESVTSYKCLDKPERWATGVHCVAAKLDSPSTLHRGVVLDEATGSWLLAVGTVIDEADIQPDGCLRRLLSDYLDQGVKVLARLDGHFALVVYDGREGSVLVVSDPFGLTSIFYGQRGSQLFVSTSALAVAKAVQSKPSEFGVRHFLIFGPVSGKTTLWQDVERMLPATVLKLTQDGVEESTYWSLNIDQTTGKLPVGETVDYVIDVLSRTMQRSLAREGKAWLSLTGGFDSRTLAAVLYHSGLPFKCYCGPLDSNDARIASHITRELGWDYEYFPLPEDWGRERSRWLSEALGKTDACLDILRTSSIVREQTLKAQQYSVSLWGFGGETVYRGYYWIQEFANLGTTSKVDYDRLLNYRALFPTSWRGLKDTASWIKLIRAQLKAELEAVGERNANWLNTAKLDLLGTYLSAYWTGPHVSAALGVQRAMSPFDFKAGIACAASTDYKWRTQSRLFRLMIERISPMLASIETTEGGPASPKRLNNLHRFVPYWLGMGRKLIWHAGHRFLGIRLWSKGRDSGSGYPWAQWRRDTLSYLEDKTLLVPAKMHSADLYDRDSLQALLAEAQTDDFRYEGLLGRIITVEMALRSVGTSF